MSIQPLHDPESERDACGIGLVADARGRASRELLDRALAGLAAVAHRGAWAADGVSGDGAGLLLPLHPWLTGEEGAGFAMCFLRSADARRGGRTHRPPAAAPDGRRGRRRA